MNCGVGKKTLLKDCTVAVTVTVVLFCKNVKNYSTTWYFVSEGNRKGFYTTTCSN